MKLKEIKNNTGHYFQDENGLLQGECKEYYDNGQLWIHCYYKDGYLHGKYKEYNEDGSLECIEYYSNGKDITKMYHKLQAWKSL